MPKKNDVFDFLSWLVTNDFSAGLPDFATPSEVMLQAGRSFKEIRERAHVLLAEAAAKAEKPPGACL